MPLLPGLPMPPAVPAAWVADASLRCRRQHGGRRPRRKHGQPRAAHGARDRFECGPSRLRSAAPHAHRPQTAPWRGACPSLGALPRLAASSTSRCSDAQSSGGARHFAALCTGIHVQEMHCTGSRAPNAARHQPVQPAHPAQHAHAHTIAHDSPCARRQCAAHSHTHARSVRDPPALTQPSAWQHPAAMTPDALGSHPPAGWPPPGSWSWRPPPLAASRACTACPPAATAR